MIKIIFLTAISLVFCGSQACAQTVNVMTWNIRFNNPRDGVNAWPNRKDWLAEIIVSNKIDIAGFQEVLVDQYDDLKQRLTEMDAYGVGRDDGQAAGEFAPIFFRRDRFELQAKSTLWLSPTPEVVGSKGWDAALPRIASWVKLRDRQSKRSLVVINTHFDHRGAEARTESAQMLAKLVREKFADLPVILTGDLNTRPNTAPYLALVGEVRSNPPLLFDSYVHSAAKPEGPHSTWNGFKAIVPDQRIDFIFTTQSIKALRVRILDDQRDGRFPSDHLPVITTVEYK